MSDTRKIQEMEQKIKELERLVGQKQILLEFREKQIEIAEEMYKIDIKKKLGTPVSNILGLSGKGNTGK